MTQYVYSYSPFKRSGTHFDFGVIFIWEFAQRVNYLLGERSFLNSHACLSLIRWEVLRAIVSVVVLSEIVMRGVNHSMFLVVLNVWFIVM